MGGVDAATEWIWLMGSTPVGGAAPDDQKWTRFPPGICKKLDEALVRNLQQVDVNDEMRVDLSDPTRCALH